MRRSRNGAVTPARFRKARADFSLSAMKRRSDNTRVRTGPGMTASGATSPSVFGTRYSVPRGSDDIESVLVEQPDERDQRQADERGGVVAFDALDQRDAQSFDFR